MEISPSVHVAKLNYSSPRFPVQFITGIISVYNTNLLYDYTHADKLDFDIRKHTDFPEGFEVLSLHINPIHTGSHGVFIHQVGALSDMKLGLYERLGGSEYPNNATIPASEASAFHASFLISIGLGVAK